MHSALTSVSRMFQVWACKQVWGIAGTNRELARWLDTSLLCPSCRQVPPSIANCSNQLFTTFHISSMPECTIISVLFATNPPCYGSITFVMFTNWPLLSPVDQPDQTKAPIASLQCADATGERALSSGNRQGLIELTEVGGPVSAI